MKGCFPLGYTRNNSIIIKCCGFSNSFRRDATLIEAVAAHDAFGIHHKYPSSSFCQSKGSGISPATRTDTQQMYFLNRYVRSLQSANAQLRIQYNTVTQLNQAAEILLLETQGDAR